MNTQNTSENIDLARFIDPSSPPEISRNAVITICIIAGAALLLVFFYSSSSAQGKGLNAIDSSLSSQTNNQQTPQGQVAGAETYGVQDPSDVSPSPTETPTPTDTPEPTTTPTPTPTSTPDPPATPTPEPTATPTPEPPATEIPTDIPTPTEPPCHDDGHCHNH